MINHLAFFFSFLDDKKRNFSKEKISFIFIVFTAFSITQKYQNQKSQCKFLSSKWMTKWMTEITFLEKKN
jgi:hypothetical protein